MNAPTKPLPAWLAPLVLLLGGLATHAAWLGRPLSVVFDEVYFVEQGRDYLEGKDFMDPHPPIAKLTPPYSSEV